MPGRPVGRLPDSPAPKGLVGRQGERADLGEAAVERTPAPFHPRTSSGHIDPSENRLGYSSREPFVNRSPNERLGAFPFVGNKRRCFGVHRNNFLRNYGRRRISTLQMILRDARCWKPIAELYKPLRVPKRRGG